MTRWENYSGMFSQAGMFIIYLMKMLIHLFFRLLRDRVIQTVERTDEVSEKIRLGRRGRNGEIMQAEIGDGE